MSNLFKSKTKKEETQKTEIDPQIYQQVLANLDLARQVASIPYQPYTGLMVAPFTRDYMAGEDVVRRIAQEGGFIPELEMAARQAAGDLGYQSGDITAPTFDPRVTAERIGAERVGQSLAGGPMQIGAGQVGTQFQAPTIGAERVGASLAGGPQQVRAGQLGTTFTARDVSGPGRAPMAQGASVLGRDIQQYMSPYTQNVIEAGLSDIDRAAALRQQDIGAQATRARAFGGSRQAVQEGIAAGEAERERNRFIAEQRAQAFNQAMQAREADTGREQQAGIANQAAVQNVMEMAQRGEISNQQRDIELQRLGVTAGTQNIESGLRADLANQQAMENYMRLGLTAEQANQQAMLDAQRSNQAAVQEAQRLGLTAQTTNVQTGLQASQANQAAMENYMRMGLTAEQANQQAMLDAARSNQGAGLQARQAELGAMGDQASRILEAQRANEAARLGAANFRLGAGSQLAGFGQQAMQNRYGAGQQLMAIGTGQQGLAQQYLDAQQQEFMRRQNYPLQQLSILQGAVAASPYNQTVTGSTTVTGRPSYFDIFRQAVGSFPMPGGGNTGSDMDMKTNVKKIKNPLDKVNRLKGIEFEWENGYGRDEDENMGGEDDMSISAQDLEKVMPSAVSRRGDGMRQYDVPQMVGLLTEAVKELDKKVSSGKKAGGKKNV